MIEHIVQKPIQVDDVVAIKLRDPVNDDSSQIEELLSLHQELILDSYPSANIEEATLMASPNRWNSLVEEMCRDENVSIILDISALPKRVGLLLLKRFLSNENVRDIVVCYTQPTKYTEGPLARDMLDPLALPGYGLERPETDENSVIISVGFSSFDLREILKRTSSNKVFFLLPFPPASPSFRRTWKFLKDLLSETLSYHNFTVERIHALDAFAAHEWIVGQLDDKENTTMIPLGPKPHSIAMALAQIGSKGTTELVYPQPHRYHPQYSTGVRRDKNGEASIIAYGIRFDNRDVV